MRALTLTAGAFVDLYGIDGASGPFLACSVLSLALVVRAAVTQ